MVLLGCATSPSPEPERASTTPERPCGMSTDDWCPSPKDDPCGRHLKEAACRLDPACTGMPYLGESFVACQPDGKGFWSNCPAVGCVTRPPPPPPEKPAKAP